MKTLIFALCLFTLSTFAEDIHLKNGSVYKNILITKKTDYAVIFTYNGGKMSVAVNDILKIDEVAYDVTKESAVIINGEKLSDEFIVKRFKFEPEAPKYIQPNINLILVSFLSGLYAIDNFIQSSTIQESIDNFKKLKVTSAGLEKEKFRRTVYGIVATAICAISLYISVDRVEIKASPTSLSLSYKF